NWSFPGATPSTSNDQYPSNIQYTTPGEYVVTLNAINQCGSSTIRDTFIVVQPGTLTLDDDYVICANEPGFNISASPGGGTWSGTGVADNGWYTPSSDHLGTHTLIYSFSEGGCDLQDSMQVTILPAPEVQAGPDQSACSNDQMVILTGASPAGGVWTVDNNGVLNGNNFDVQASGPGLYTLTYSYSNANNCSASASKTILIQDLPEVEAGPDQSFCNGPGDIVLTGFSPAGGNWTGPGVSPNGVFNAANSPGLGTYQLYYSYTDPNTTCTNVDSLSVAVIETDAVEAGPDLSLCIDAAPVDLALTAAPLGGTWLANGSEGLVGSIFNPATAGVGTHVISYSVGQGTCEASDILRIEIFPLPNINVIQDQAICINEGNLTLTATPSGGTWTANNGGQLNGNEFSPDNSGPGNYNFTYTYSNANGCEASAEVNITVNDLPPLMTTDTTFCNGPGNVELTGYSPIGGIWSGPGVSPNGVFNAANTPGVGTYQLYYFYTDPNTTCTNQDSSTVTVIEPDDVEAGPDLSLCIDAAPIDLASTAAPVGGSWSANGSEGLVGSIFNPATAGVGTHVISYSVGQGTCEATDILRIEVFPLPNISIIQDQAVCINDENLNLTATPSGGTWTANNGGQLNGNEFSPDNSGPGTYNFTYTYTNANGCESSAEVNITVNDLPPLTTTDTTFCNGPGNVELTGYSPSGGIWSGPGVNSNGIFNAANAPGIGSYQLYYTYTDPNNFCTNVDSMTLTLVESATADAGPDLSLCVDANPVDLSIAASPGGGIWLANGSDGLFGTIFNPSIAGVGTHLLSYTIGEGTCSATDLIEIEVYALPNVNVGQDIEICVDTEDIPLLANPVGGSWVANNGGQLDGNQFSPSQSGPGNYNFTYTYTNANGCEASADMNVIVNALPVLTTNDTTYCNTPGLVTLPFTSPGGGTWSGSGVINNFFNPQLAGGPGFYILTYEYTDPNGCTNTIESNIQVVMPNPLDAGNNQNLCIDEGAIDLSQNAYPAGGNWYTTSNGGLSGSIFDPAEAGEGTHLMIYSQGTGNCEVRDSLYVTVHPLPQVFAGIDLEACFGESSFQLKGNSPPGGVWSGIGLIDVEDGIFDPSGVNPGNYTLTYSYTNASGCYEEDTRVVTVFPMEEPEFDLPDLACRNEPVQFTNNSPVGYDSHWNFGDNHTSNSFNPVHSFTNPGVYNILLTVENEFGCMDTISHPITITDLPNAYFTPDTAEACSGIYVHLNNTSDGEGLEYLWDFGNGQTSTAERPDIFYLDPGINDTTYVISLTVTNICGTSFYQELITVHPDPKATFGMAPQTDCSPLIIDFANSSTGSITHYFWDFGNGQTSTDPFPEPQTYTTDTTTTIYTAMLIATNVCGSDTIYKDIVVEPAQVQAFFELSDDDGCAPHEVQFNNFSTNGAIIEWDFGDGNTSTQVDPIHTFEEPGIYTVIQYAYSECGYDTATVEIEVIPPPAVLFTHAPFVCVGQEISFENLSINISGNAWDFGDGNSSFLTSPTHVFDSVGTYTVTLTGLSSVNQCPAVYTSEVLVKGLPDVQFDSPVTYGCAPLSIQFDNQSEGVEFFEWDFGDGNTSIEENPSHVYLDSGTYEVKLTVTDANGCFNDTSILNLLVNPVPTAQFAYEKDQLCGLPADIYFENQSVGANGFEWHFGDSIQSIFNDPTHTYENSGDYEIQMIAVNEYGCRDTTEDAFTIFPQPTAEFNLLGQEGCTPLEVEFGNRSLEANHYLWDFGDGTYSEEANPVHVYDEVGNYDVRLMVGVDETCFDTVELNSVIQVFPTPIANFEMEEILENGQKTGQYDITNLSEDAEFYFWDFGDGGTSEEENPSHRYFTNAVKQVYLEASNDYGCVADTLISLYPNFIKGLFVPNGFSPEQGIGDVRLFKPKGVGMKEYHIRVFSTYGQLLWESKELEDGQPAEAWDGVYQGKLLPQDVYVWKASAIFEDGTVWRGQQNEKGKYQVMGSVILLR
ncbi:MAG: PKD domain-containing protein, partial [Bacteroidota bacterium]